VPPYVVTEQQVDDGLARLRAVLSSLPAEAK
jgi:acetylornithine/succinyldiaminopimelate/putrescine aminotransferase